MMKIRGMKSATFASTTIFACALFFGGCTVGPNYKSPNTDVPTSYRTLPPAEPVVTPALPPPPNRWATKNGGKFFRMSSCRN